MTSPSSHAMPIPILRGWCTHQNVSTRARRSGTPRTSCHGRQVERERRDDARGHETDLDRQQDVLRFAAISLARYEGARPLRGAPSSSPISGKAMPVASVHASRPCAR